MIKSWQYITKKQKISLVFVVLHLLLLFITTYLVNR